MATTEFTTDELQDLEQTTVWSRLFCVPAGAIGFAALISQWPSGDLAWTVAWQLFASYALFCWTNCFHETAHHTLCGSKAVSMALGRVLGTVMLLPYSVYRESHIRHHAYLNKPRDWELWPYSDPGTSRTFRRLFVWLDLLLGFVVSPLTYSRIYFSRNCPIRQRSVLRTIAWEYAALVAFWGTVLALVAWNGAWSDFFRIWVVPHWFAGVFQTLRKFTEHLGMASYDPMLGTRTVIGSGWVTRFCSWVNFGVFVHGPHHRHPRLSHDRLEEKMLAYRQQHRELPFPLFTTYLSATRSMLPHLFTTAGVGVNAGGEWPRDEKDRDVRNFVRDVAQEVLADADREVSSSTV